MYCNKEYWQSPTSFWIKIWYKILKLRSSGLRKKFSIAKYGCHSWLLVLERRKVQLCATSFKPHQNLRISFMISNFMWVFGFPDTAIVTIHFPIHVESYFVGKVNSSSKISGFAISDSNMCRQNFCLWNKNLPPMIFAPLEFRKRVCVISFS